MQGNKILEAISCFKEHKKRFEWKMRRRNREVCLFFLDTLVPDARFPFFLRCQPFPLLLVF